MATNMHIMSDKTLVYVHATTEQFSGKHHRFRTEVSTLHGYP